MARYSSDPVTVGRPAADIAEKFSDFTRLQDALASLPAEEREKVGEVSFTNDSININTAQVGQIVLRRTECSPRGMKLVAEHSPVPMGLEVTLAPMGNDATEVVGTIEVEIPKMLQPIIGGTMQKAAKQFGSLFARLA